MNTLNDNTPEVSGEDVLAILKSGKELPMEHPKMHTLKDSASEAFKVLKSFNQEYNIDHGRDLFTTLIGKKIPESSTVYPPFYTNYGKNITIGENVFINHDCSMLDLGGITIEDEVMIGPRVSITSENHPVNPATRKTLVPGSVTIKKNAWIGGGAFILPGVTIGENSVVAAGAVVNRDVPANVVVGGVPAKIIKQL